MAGVTKFCADFYHNYGNPRMLLLKQKELFHAIARLGFFGTG
jgi:hypothetical protein